jgi:amino acid transporter
MSLPQKGGTPDPGPRVEGIQYLRGNLGVKAIVFMVVAAAAPLTTVGGGFPVQFIVGNGPGMPAMYLIALIVLLFFAVGLSAMARYLSRPGAFFTYVAQGLGRPLGLGTAYLAVFTYTMIQVAVYGLIGDALSNAVVKLGGPSIGWWMFSLGVCVACGLLGYRNIELSSKVLGVLMVAEIVIVLLLNIAIMVKGGNQGLSLEPFTRDAVLSGAPGIGLMLATNGFMGFEATAIFRTEARDPNRTIPRATYIAVLLIGVFYAWTCWAIVMAWGPDKVLAAAKADPAGMVMTTADTYLGAWASATFNVLLITSVFAAILGFHNVLSRYQHAMACATALPRTLAAVHSKHSSPHISSLVQCVTAALVIVLCGVCRLDPLLEVLAWFAGVATVGVVMLMALTCLAVLVYFRRITHDDGPWRTVIAPAIGLVGLVGILVIAVANLSLLIGGSDVLAGLFIGLLITALGVGIVQAIIIRRRGSAAYAALAEAMTG